MKLILMFTKHPDYILGKTIAKPGAISLNTTNIPILKEDLKKIKIGNIDLEKITGHTTGAGVLAMTLLLATKFSGSYFLQVLTLLTRALTAEVDYLISFGKYLDKVTQKIGIRFDEQGILEKDEYISWMCGLGLNLVSNYKRPKVATIAYVSATGGGYIANRVVCLTSITFSPQRQLHLPVNDNNLSQQIYLLYASKR